MFSKKRCITNMFTIGRFLEKYKSKLNEVTSTVARLRTLTYDMDDETKKKTLEYELSKLYPKKNIEPIKFDNELISSFNNLSLEDNVL